MASEIRDLLSSLKSDKWRAENPFSAEMDATHAALASATGTDEQAHALNEWIRHHQPCLFGRIAAAAGQLSHLVLTREHIAQGDDAVHEQIRSFRRRWGKAARAGKTSGFVLSLIDPSLAHAEPDQGVGAIARRLVEMLVHETVNYDQIYHLNALLETPDRESTIWRWVCGINFFSAHADGRWWQDHRIPGGIALSINSVGHLVKSLFTADQLDRLESEIGVAAGSEGLKGPRSVGAALVLAMKTIAKASPAISGVATRLLGAATLPRNSPACPVVLPSGLGDKNYCEYEGYYHTDYTLPSEYFEPNMERPSETEAKRLDFTYLFHSSGENLDFFRMGEGEQIADLGPAPVGLRLRAQQMFPELLEVDEAEDE